MELEEPPIVDIEELKEPDAPQMQYTNQTERQVCHYLTSIESNQKM